MACILSKAGILYRTAFHKNIIPAITKITLVKNCSHFTNRTNIRAEQRFRQYDNISNDYKLVYREQKLINIIVITAYNIGWLGLVFGTGIVAYMIYKDPPLVNEDIKKIYGVLKPLSKLDRIILMVGGVIMCILLIIASKVIPLRIYHSHAEKLYKIVFAYKIFSKKDILTFAEGTATLKFKRSGSITGALYNINGRTVLLDEECFPVQSVRDKMIRKTD